MSYSIIFSLPKKLRTVLEAAYAASAVDGVQVTTGPRSTPAGAREVAVQELRSSAGRPLTGGIRRQEGSFVLRAYWEVKGAGEDAIDAAREEVDGLLAIAADALEADVTLGGLLRFCDIDEIAEDDQALARDGRSYTAHVRVSFTADVNPGA